MIILKKLFYKKKYIIFSLTAILTLLIIPNSAKALTIPSGHGDNYFIIKRDNPPSSGSGDYTHAYYIYFTNLGYTKGYVSSLGSVGDTHCISANTYCIKTLRSYPAGGNSNARYNYVMYSDDGDNWTYVGGNRSFTANLYDGDGYILKSSVEIVSLDQQTTYYPAGYEYKEIPDYLIGYQKVTLRGLSYNEDHYYVISGISQGSFYVPYEYVLNYDSSFAYVNENWDIIPWSARVTDYYIMEDELYVRYDFNINDFPDAQFIQYDKMGNFFQGTDYPSVDIYVPSTSYGSLVTVTPNSSGGNDFDYTWKDEQGNIITTTNEFKPGNNNPLLPDFLKDFSTDTFGLTSIITAPLNVISNITSTTCTEITLPLPYVDKNIVLPCMSTIYSSTFGDAFTLYQTLSFGFISYWVIVRILNLVKDFKNPDHDEIEVVDL